ncbi:MAG: YkvA family protein [Candidatus Dormibacteraceae bacterium]
MNLGFVRHLVLDVPRQGKLAYCLLRDERVPSAPKAALLGGLGLIVSPLDLPAWIPVVGELDMLALGVLAVRVFVQACPDELVEEHRQALKRGDSRFHEDVRDLGARTRMGAARVYSAARARAGSRPSSPGGPAAGG